MTVTGSRHLDLALCLLLLSALFFASAVRLRVYFRVTVADVRAFRVDPGGRRTEIAVPEDVRRMHAATLAPEAYLAALERRIRERTWPLRSGQTVEWVVRYAANSTRLDRERRFVVSGPVAD